MVCKALEGVMGPTGGECPEAGAGGKARHLGIPSALRACD